MPAKTIRLSELNVTLPRRYYHRTLSEKGEERLKDLEFDIISFNKAYEEAGYGSFSYKRGFLALIDQAAKAFGAFKAENLAEFTGISSGTIIKIRKGHLPTEKTVRKILDTTLDACRFYLENKPSEGLPGGWVAVPIRAKDCIAELSELLDTVLLIARNGNEKSDLVLTPIERSQLIAILETALQLLRSPLVERNFLGKLQEILVRCSKKAAEKQLELGLSSAARVAAGVLGDFLKKFLS